MQKVSTSLLVRSATHPAEGTSDQAAPTSKLSEGRTKSSGGIALSYLGSQMLLQPTSEQVAGTSKLVEGIVRDIRAYIAHKLLDISNN